MVLPWKKTSISRRRAGEAGEGEKKRHDSQSGLDSESQKKLP